MPEFLLELFSEEIPARMQARGAEDFRKTFVSVYGHLLESEPRSFYGPRRIGLTATILAEVTTPAKEERGPRVGAPDAAIAGFLKKHGASRENLVERNGFWVFDKPGETISARDLLARHLPSLVSTHSWPKSMRWGTSGFTWVRPLQRILCLLDGEVVRFDLRQGDDAAHGLASGNLTEGHRVMAPGAFEVASFAGYETALRERRVILDAAERVRVIEDGLAALAAQHGVQVVPDRGLLEEVAGLVEWPVPLLGRIDDAFMDLPPELMRTTMRVNQRYFAMVTPDGRAAPCFGVVANIAATDGGAALVAGNERVLRARLSDARFFWDQDRKQQLEDFLPKLKQVVFHAKLGTQGQRVARLERLARHIAPMVGADPALAARAARLAKADLASGMVGEFPELQGVMGRYYALAASEDPQVAEAIGNHYRPLGPTDAVPSAHVGIAAALADKLDTLSGFFAVGEKPTGSGDPFALRRAALGVIRIIRENALRVPLQEIVLEAVRYHAEDAALAVAAPLGQSLFRGRDRTTSYTKTHWDEVRLNFPKWLLSYDGYFEHLLHAFQGLTVPDEIAQQVDDEIETISHLDIEMASITGLAPGAEALRNLSYAQLRQASLYSFDDETMSGFPARYVRAVAWVRERAGIVIATQVLDFLAERLRVQLRAEGARHDVVAAAFTAGEDDLVRLLARADALKALVESETGTNLLAAYKRAQNILRIEEKKDGPHAGPVDPALLTAPEEQALAAALDAAEPATQAALAAEDYSSAMSALAALRGPVDAFFDRVTVNDPDKQLRRNRLCLLTRLRTGMDAVADFSRIEG